MSYNNATICENGHVISYSVSNAETFCSQCGSRTISACPTCNTSIRGTYEADGIAIVGNRSYKKPMYCFHCGTPFPWTQKILDNAVELLSLEDDLPAEAKDVIKNAVPNLIVDTPNTPVAVAKYKKLMSSAGHVVVSSMRQLLIDVVSEAVKKALFS